MAEATNSRKKLRMDRSLWSDFPQDPLQEALARLPLRSLAQYRTVSKTWDTKIAGLWKCGATLRSTASVVEEGPDKYWLAFGNGFCYNPSINKYHQIDTWLGSSSRVLATSGGIMLCGTYYYWTDDEFKLSVGNPLKANCWTLLPEHPRRLQPNYEDLDEVDMQPVGFGIVEDKDSHTFKVVIVVSWGTFRTPLESHLYDSQSKSWKVIKTNGLLVDALRSLPHMGGVCYKNYLLYIVNPAYPATVNYIMAFSLKAETWHAVELANKNLYYCYLVVCGERLFITGEDVRYTTVVIFEFQKRSEELDDLDGTWLMVGSLDRLLLEKTLPKWQGALPICPKSSSTRAPTLITCFARRSSSSCRKLLFHVDENTWYKVEFEVSCPLEDCWRHPAMVFTPRLEFCACT